MKLSRRTFVLTLGAVALAGLAAGTPPFSVTSASAATPRATSGPAALRARVLARYPAARVAVNPITGAQKAYSLVVNLANQPGVTLSTGAGASILTWYLQALPNQSHYVLYSFERAAGGTMLWQYDYVPAAHLLRRYRFDLTSTRAYPWTSWQLTPADIARAAQTGVWPRNGVSHQPVTASRSSQNTR